MMPKSRLLRYCSARRKEKLFAVDAIRRNRIKAGLRRQPFMPDPGFGGLHVRPLGGIDQNASVRIEQCRIALGQDCKILAVLEVGPGGAVSESIGVESRRGIERRTHALTQVAIPGLSFVRLNAGRFPKPKLHAVGAAVIAPACERGPAVGYAQKCFARILRR